MQPKDENMRKWIAHIRGPTDTPYEGGLFKVELKIPEDYPFVAPKVIFKTKIFHPNIGDDDGYTCLDILKDNWTPSTDFITIISQIQNLMSCPNFDSPYNSEAADLYEEDQDRYFKKAKKMTEEYADDEDDD